MPIVFCEICGYEGVGKTPKECLSDVLAHEEREHSRYEDRDWLLERDMEEIDDDKRKSDT